MLIQHNFSLKKLNTFGINVYTRYFFKIKRINEVINFFRFWKKSIPKILLGNGSNILFLKNYYPGIVIQMGIKGKKIIYEDRLKVIVQAFSGEDWNEFVTWTIEKGFSGLENLSFIPGTVGAAPIQNIGAYGSEIKDSLIKVQAYEIVNQKFVELKNSDCFFSYRSSIFKNPCYKNQLLIISVFFFLRKKKITNLNCSYLEIKKELNLMNVKIPNLKNIREAIFKIRNRKIPNPKRIGNAGSFFMNPIVNKFSFQKLKIKYPDIIGYPMKNKNKIKLSANFLIEKIGWKGKKIGNVGVYKKKPIILVNYGGASGMEIYSLSKEINKKIKKKFGFFLSREVNLIY